MKNREKAILTPASLHQHRAGSKSAAESAGGDEQITVSGEQTAVISEIRRIHNELRAAARLTVTMAIELGGHLVNLKKNAGRKWLLFAKNNLPFCEKTAQRYMTVFKNRAQLEEKFDTVSDFTLSQAYEFLAMRKPDRKSKAAKSDDPAGGNVKAAIITGLSRSLCDGLERLSEDKLRKFEADMLGFKEKWLQEHREDKK